jgi:type 1 glutamine amidotransferase
MNKHFSRRKFIKTGLATGAASLIGPAKILSADKSKKSVLWVWGGWDGHEPEKCLELFLPWLKEQDFDLRISDSLDIYVDQEYMRSVDLIIQIWTMGTIKEEQEKGLLSAVSSGTGLTGWHGGLGDSFRNNTEYQFMIGGQWVAHPGGIIDYKVHISDPADPVTNGINDFKMHSEQYYMHVDPNNKVLATTTFTGEHAHWINGCTMPVVWKKIYGKGRVFYSSLCHIAIDFVNSPAAMEIMKRGILWAVESKYQGTKNLIEPVY